VWCSQAPVGYVGDERRRLAVDALAADRECEAYQMRVTGAAWVALAKHLGVTAWPRGFLR
jgi:hypothetical protein